MTEAPAQLTAAIAALWQGPPVDLRGSPDAPVQQISGSLRAGFPAGTRGKAGAPDVQGVSGALVNALRATGTPWAFGDGVAAFLPGLETSGCRQSMSNSVKTNRPALSVGPGLKLARTPRRH
jgi:hypothetical protein